MRAILITLTAVCVTGCTAETETTRKEEPAPAAIQRAEKPAEKVDPQPKEPVAPAATPKNPLESKLTAENYLRIKEGMPRDEVLLILGPPTESNFEDEDKSLRESGAARKYLVNISMVRERWFIGGKNVVPRGIDVDFKWKPEEPGSLLGKWRVVRKSYSGLLQ
ncbi:MAG: hypothetical protein KatS3mg105_4924 [Gemmatales bacterium]|nr:MAG: hypothetical protein KatS3mg105_4924 [Gemmatales bacterium]